MAGSFIPQHPTKGKVAAKSFRKIYVLSYVSYIVFFTTLIAAAGVFFYDVSLKSQLSSLRQDLVDQKKLFNQADLDRVRILDHRVDTAKQLVDGHASVNRVLDALDAIIADPVQFLSFNYNRKEDYSRPRIRLAAVASEFDEAIFQDRIFDGNEITNNFEVVGIDLNTQPIDGERLDLGVQQVVNLGLASELDLSLINYTGQPSSAEQPVSIPRPTDGNPGFGSDGSETTDESSEGTENEGSESAEEIAGPAAPETDGGETDQSGGSQQ